MKVLCIPDIHCRNYWRKLIENDREFKKVIFLGDYIDPYYHEIINYPETMELKNHDGTYLNLLEDIISLKKNDPNKYILLTGNHTDHYIWDEFKESTRLDKNNYNKYHEFFNDNLDLFNLVYVQDNVIFSHAGINEIWAKNYLNDAKEKHSISKVAKILHDIPLKEYNKNIIRLLNYISPYRGGFNSCGSCEWSDIREHIDIHKSTIEHIIPKGEDGIYQIFGHTQLKDDPLITDKWACLDCRKGFIIDTLTYKIESI